MNMSNSDKDAFSGRSSTMACCQEANVLHDCGRNVNLYKN